MTKEYIVINPSRGGVSQTIKANYGRMSYANAIHTDTRKATFIMERKIKQIGNIRSSETFNNPTAGRVYGIDGVSPTICAHSGGCLEPKIAIEPQVLRMERTEEEKQRRHNQGDKGAKYSAAKQFTPRTDGVSNTLTTNTKDNMVCEPMGVAHPLSHKKEHPKPKDGLSPALRATDYKCPTCAILPFEDNTLNWRIRKLTPRECFRLMDVDDADIDRIQSVGIPKTGQYKLAGNSIVVSVLYHIFRKMFVEQNNESKQLTLF